MPLYIEDKPLKKYNSFLVILFQYVWICW